MNKKIKTVKVLPNKKFPELAGRVFKVTGESKNTYWLEDAETTIILDSKICVPFDAKQFIKDST